MIGVSDLKITKNLDNGGNGFVYLAKDAQNKSYAVKVIVGPEKEFLAWREFEIGNGLNHCNLGRCLNIAKDQLYPNPQTGGFTLSTCLVLEYIAGSNLFAHVVVKPFNESVSRFLFS